MRDKKIRKTVIITGYQCNNNCRFCFGQGKRGIPASSTRQVLSEITRARRRGTDYLEIIGGEETIRPDIVEIVGYAKSLGFANIAMVTNGRMFSYGKFAGELITAGLTDIIFSIHGHNARLHDSLTRVKGSFAQLIRGVANVKKRRGCRIASNTTIVR